MDPSGPDSSSEGLYEGNLPPSPSPPSRQYPASPKDMPTSSGLAFRPPPRPGSSMRKGRKSDFNTPAPPPLPAAPLPTYEHTPLADATNLGSHHTRLDQTFLFSSPSRNSTHSTGPFPADRKSFEAGQTVDMTRIVRERLQVLREENETQVNSAGLLGQGLLELRGKIESLMDELADELSAAEDHSEDSHDSKPGNARIRELNEKIEAEIDDLQRQKQRLFSEITMHNVDISNSDFAETSSLRLSETPSKATRVADAIRNLTATPGKSPVAQTNSTPRQSDRRSRNAAARQAKADTDLINEIQAGLVQEVRRLQGLLKERDDQRVSLERSHAELEKQLDQYKPRVIQMTETEDALKQENWDLNVSKQNLEEQLGEIKAALKKAELDNIRLNKEVSKARETVDSQRLQIDGHVAELERLNKTRETEIALARRERAGMQRDVSDLQSELQKFRNQQLNGGGVSRSVSNSFMSEITNDDAHADTDALAARLRAASGEAPQSPGESIYSHDGGVLSPLGNRMGRDKETQDLRAKLALAQRKAGKDAVEKRRVREKNAELTKLLVKAGVKVPQGLDDDAETSEDEELHWLDDNEGHSPSAKRLSRVRSGRPASSRPRLGRKIGMVSSHSTDSIIEYAEFEDDSQIGTPAGPEDASPSRASLDGMDPAFADLSRADAGNASIDSVASRSAPKGHRSRPSVGSSPLARTTVAPQLDGDEGDPTQQRSLPKSARRSGATVRPASAVFAPSALGNELGGLAAELEQHEPAEVREMLESSMQTEDLPDLVALALAKRDEQHKVEIRSIRSEHAAAIEAIHSEHASKVSTLQRQHAEAIEALGQKHAKEMDDLTAVHEKRLGEKDHEHAVLMESTLAERTKAHEAALAEARSRHSRALAEQVAASSAALAAAVASHKTSSENLERKVKEEKELKEASHLFALAQKDRQHKESLEDLKASHAEALGRLRDEHQQMLAIREKALEEADAQLDELRQAAKELETSHALAIASMQESHRVALAERDAENRALSASHAATIADLQERHRVALAGQQKLRDEAAAAHALELASLHESHLAVTAKHEQSSKELAASHAAEIAALRETHQEALETHEKATRNLATTHAAELAALQEFHRDTVAEQKKSNKELSASHAAAVAALQEAHREALASRDAELVSSKQALEARSQELHLAREEIAVLQNSMAALRAELEQIKLQLAELHKAHTAVERELSETKSNLEMANDKVRRQEETALKLARQREAEATAAAAAVAARSEALTATENEKEQLEAAHAVAIAHKERKHQDAIKELEERHATTVAHLRSEHKVALESRDQVVESHQQLVAEKDRELVTKRADLQKAQAKAESLEQQLRNERERAAEQQRNEAEKAQARIESLEQQLVSQREIALEEQLIEVEKLQAQVRSLEEHLASERDRSVEDQRNRDQTTQARLQAMEEQLAAERERALEQQRLDAEKAQSRIAALEQQLVSERERSLSERRAEVENVQSQVLSLEQQITKLQEDATLAHQSRSTAEVKLKEAQSAHSALQKQHDAVKATIASLQSKVRYLESSIAAQRSSTEQNRIASDKELQTIQSALNTAQKKVREQEAIIAKAEAAAAAALGAAAAAEAQLQARNDLVTDTENEVDDFKDAVEAGDGYATEVDQDAAARKAPLVERKDSSCQTDDDAWEQFQQQQQRKAIEAQTSTPASPLQPTSESLAARNKLVILGAPKLSSRPRDSVGTFGGERSSSPAPMQYSADAFSNREQSRRPSADSTSSRITESNASEALHPVHALPDKTKAPIMAMPPPPSMPPPSLKRNLAGGQAPPRPTSPPPADLLTRAQQRHLQVPAGSNDQPRSVSRASGRSGPPPSAYASTSRARQQSSGTGSMRSRTYSNDSANQQPLDGSIYNNLASSRKSIGSRKSAARRPNTGPRESSAASFVSDVTSEVSRRLSMMSHTSDAIGGDETFVPRDQAAAGKSHGPRGLSGFGADATDPAIIHAITQTMIGEYMYKYTRKSMGRGGHSDKRHRRYFWLHPYTKMLYWTISDPGGAKVSEGTSKSASIESVRVVEDINPSPPGLHHESIIITTATREVKISAPNRERHETWLAALDYLVHRPTIQDATVVASNAAPDLMSDAENDPTLILRNVGRRAKPRASAATLGSASTKGPRQLSAQRSFLSRRSSDQVLRTESTPRKRGNSIGAQSLLYPSLNKRRDVAAREFLEQHERDREMSVSMSPSHSLRNGIYSASLRSAEAADESYDLLDLTATQSPLRRALAKDDPRLKTAEQMLEEDEPEDWDGLTNVRACCDGKHDVGSLAHHHHHFHGGSASSSRKSSRLHHRESSGSRFSSIGLKTKLDVAVKAAEERERPEAVPQIPASFLPGGTGLGKVIPDRESIDSSASIPAQTDKVRITDASFASVFGTASSEQPTSNRATTGLVGPSYGEKIQQIRKARQSAGSTTGR